jgi:hypothetical protein
MAPMRADVARLWSGCERHAHVAALDWLATGNASQSINLGNGPLPFGRGGGADGRKRDRGPVRVEICPRPRR